MEKLLFEALPLSAEVKRGLQEMGFTEASPIQEKAIPSVLRGNDILGQAATGTGKTGAFGIPAVELANANNPETQALILCPTRELAVQVADEIKKFARFKQGLNVVAIYGGESIDRQIKQLKNGAQIVVGTPGRIMDHLDRGTLTLGFAEMVILDEADEMLNMGFRDDIEFILERITQAHQTLLFSATMSKEIMAIAKKYQYEPEIIKLNTDKDKAPSIDQFYYKIQPRKKAIALTKLLEYHNIKLAMVFCNTKRMVDELVEQLNGMGYAADGLHGDMQQNKRNIVMSKFRNGKTRILIATDVAARGIDVDNIEAVFNYDLPVDDEFYVHRIGRTGRNGKQGMSLSFVLDRDLPRVYEIMRYTNLRMVEAKLPTDEEISAIRIQQFSEVLAKESEAVNQELVLPILNAILETGITVDALAMALLHRELGQIIPKPQTEKRERPERERSDRPERGDRSMRNDRGDRNERRGERGDRNGDRFERGDRAERSPRPKRERQAGDENMVRLFVSVGRRDNIRPGDLVGAFAGEAGIPGNAIGSIDIFDKYSFVDVPADMAHTVVEAMDKNQIKRKTVSVEIAKMETA